MCAHHPSSPSVSRKRRLKGIRNASLVNLAPCKRFRWCQGSLWGPDAHVTWWWFTLAKILKKKPNDLLSGVREAREIVLYLTPLKPLFEALESTELSEVTPMLEPLMHCICILWARCASYRKPDRIVTLFKEVTNLFINMVSSFYWCVPLVDWSPRQTSRSLPPEQEWKRLREKV